jgi:hypothetical protein
MKKILLLLIGVIAGQLNTVAQTNTVYDRSGWTVTASSSEPTADLPNGPAAKLLDGDNNTYWLSNITTAYEGYPHILVVDMQVSQPVNQIYYVPRNNPGTSPYSGTLSFGDDGINFGTEIPVLFSYSFGQNFINLPTTQNHRYFRISITQNQLDHDSGVNLAYLTTLAEVGAGLNSTFDAGLTSFTVQAQAAGIQLNWSTAFETNSISYNVTRSSDAVNFTTIGTITATGTPSTPTSYTFTDAAPLTGTTFYRLEQVTSTLPVQKSSIKNTDFPVIAYSSPQSKNLNVFYFLPAGKEPYANFKTRISSVMSGLQNYYRSQMQLNGRGPKTFSLTKDATQLKVQITVVNGRYPFDNYKRDTGGGPAIQAEIDDFIAANPNPYFGDHNLTVTPAFGYDPATGIVDERIPVYGTGKDCYTLDYPTLDYSYIGLNSIEGNAATVNIGGTAHEGGHSFGLSHNNLKVSEVATLGDALMNGGNYTYGKTPTSLTATDAAILNHCQVFNPDGASFYGPNHASIAAVHACYSASKNAIILTGQITNNGSPVTDVSFYNDPANGTAAGIGANKDYDAVSWNAQTNGTNNFYIEMPINELHVLTGQYELNIRLIQQDGNLTDNYYHYSFTNNLPVLNDPAFTPVTANITASAGANGSISSPGGTVVSCAANQTYTLTPNAGYAIQDVLVDGVSVGAVTTYTFTSVYTDHTISATFVALVNYTITASAGTNGSVSPNGSTTVVSGVNQTYTITPNACYQIADVIVDGVSQGAVGTFTFTNVTANHTISATFSSTATTNSTSITACNTYTWANNSQTYTASGTYTGTTTNCVTEQLVLTINNSTTNGSLSTTAVGSYTWALPLGTGIVYTTSGVYTNTTINASGCPNVATLNLTITTSSTVNTFTIGSSCGATISGLSVTINTPFVSGVSTYTFRLTNLVTSAVQIINRPVNSFALSNYGGVTLGTAYQVEVSTNGGITYGTPCIVNTPSPIATIGAQCGTTLTSMTQFVYCTYVASVTGYRFRVTNNTTGAVQILNSGLNRFNFNSLPVRSFGTAYFVEVALRNTDGTYLPFNVGCTITTPAFPTSEVILSQCDTVVTSNTQTISAVVVSGATEYRFQLVNSSLPYSFSIDRPVSNFNLSMFSGLQSGTIYTVRVAVRIGGVWGSLTGKPCNITTPGVAAGGLREIADNFVAIAYPNPFAENFMFNVTTTADSTIQIRVYDMLGKQVENRNVDVSEIENLQVGSNYTSGVYNVIVSQEGNTQTVRVIKR